MSDLLANYLSIEGRFTRSVAIARDLKDPSALDGYIVTPSVISVISRIGSAVRARSSQRAWKIIGPYGSGKSALGLLLAHLFEGSRTRKQAFSLVEGVDIDAAAFFRPGHKFYPLVLTGSRTELSIALAAAIRLAIEQINTGGRKPTVYQQIDLEKGTYHGEPLTSSIAALLADFSGYVVTKDFGGVLLIIDEMGKFIEHAATFPDGADLATFQQLAEMASGVSDTPIYVVGLLHQHFDSYASDMGRKLADEWHKVAARFEEIIFDEPVEQYAHFAASTLCIQPSKVKSLGISSVARDLYKQATEFGFLRSDSASKKVLSGLAERLFPIHPGVLSALPIISKKFGQSERSFHAFLRGAETYSLNDFSKRTIADRLNWYSLHNLFDYLTHGVPLRFRSLEVERRWDFARAVIDRNLEADSLDVVLLKTIAILDLISSNCGVLITPETLAFCLQPRATLLGNLDIAIERLVTNGVLLRRRSSGELTFAIDTSVNIEALYEDLTARHDPESLIVSGAQQLVLERRVIAHRHFQLTGTIRTLSTVVYTLESYEADSKGHESALADGSLVVILSPNNDRDLKRARNKLAAIRDGRVMACLIPIDMQVRHSLEALSRWLLVKDYLAHKRIDPWTERYVELRLQEVREIVERDVLSKLFPDNNNDGPGYWVQGKLLKNSERMNVSQAASLMFDKLYSATPILHNELINRDRLSSSIVVARQRLVELLLEKASEERLGITDYPPERLIYTTIFRNTKLHRQTGHGDWTLASPIEGSPTEVVDVWRAIGKMLQQQDRSSFGLVIKEFAKPPFGLRSGPASLLVAAYLIVNRGSCAVFERGTLVVSLTTEHFARMFKNPEAFELREFDAGNGHAALLNQYSTALAAVGFAPEDALSYLNIARALIRWYSRLPDYSKETLTVSAGAKAIRSAIKKASDPIALLTDALPRIVSENGKADTTQSFADKFTGWLTEISYAERRLRDEISRSLGDSFGVVGPLRTIRSQLQKECAGTASELADFRLKSFLLRCADVALPDDKWLASIASIVVQRPLDAWDDHNILQFREEIAALSNRYKRWLGVVMQKGRYQDATQRFLGVTLTKPNGEENLLLVTTSKKSAELSGVVLAELTRQCGKDHSLMVTALAQALAELQQIESDDAEHGSGHGRQRTS